MDHLQTRLDTLEQMSTITRQLRWWRGLACGLVVLSLLSWALPSGTAQEHTVTGSKKKKDLEERVAALEDLLKHFSRKGNEVRITGANLHIRNGIGSTDCLDEQFDPIPDCPNGLGNLIVGYNEPREPDFGETIRTGSHNVVVGQEHNFSRFGGVVVGARNTISGDFSSVTAGAGNTAWLPVFKAPNGAMLLTHLSPRHRAEVQVKRLLERMRTEDIGTVAAEAFEVIEEDKGTSSPTGP